MKKLVLLLLLCSWSSSVAFAQVQELETTSTPIKTQKYNGYGLPNTKFKKVKVSAAKKATKADPKMTVPTIVTTPTTTAPKSSLQPNNTVVAVKPTTAEKKLVSFNMDYDFSYNAQMQEQKDHARAEYLVHEFMPQMKIGDFSVMGDFVYYDDIKDPGANEWLDSALLLRYKAWNLGSYFTLSPAVILGLPLSKASRESSGIKYSIGPTLSLGLNTKNMGLEQLRLSYYVRYAKYATEFDTKPNGDPSADYLIRQRLNLGFGFTDKFSFSGRFEFNSGYSNQGVVRNSYVHVQSFGYQFTPMIAGYIAHSSGGSVYTISENAEGDLLFENDLKFYDPKASEVGIGMTLSF